MNDEFARLFRPGVCGHVPYAQATRSQTERDCRRGARGKPGRFREPLELERGFSSYTKQHTHVFG